MCVVWFQVHPKFLSSISTCCLYIAAKANESAVLTSSLRDLLVLGQSGGSVTELIHTERLIVELLGTEVMEAAATCNPLAFLRMFHNILLVDCGVDSGCLPALDLSLLVSKLEVIMCHFDFTRFHVSQTVCRALNFVVANHSLKEGELNVNRNWRLWHFTVVEAYFSGHNSNWKYNKCFVLSLHCFCYVYFYIIS